MTHSTFREITWKESIKYTDTHTRREAKCRWMCCVEKINEKLFNLEVYKDGSLIIENANSLKSSSTNLQLTTLLSLPPPPTILIQFLIYLSK